MLFTKKDIEKLGLLNQTAELCNIFFTRVENDLSASLINSFIDYTINEFFEDLKKFIFELDLRLIESGVAIDLLKKPSQNLMVT